METVEFIKSFIDFIAGNGFNSLTLYLEGRVRTVSFPCPVPSDSYSAEEMREVVRHAELKGVGVIPVIGTLGHAELFLSHPEMAHLAEVRPPFPGRFGPSAPEVFCPSLPETSAFLRAYLTEICEIFPSPYIHAGCDEAWDMACCDLCRNRLANGEEQGALFRDHLLNVHQILTEELGRRMMIWDDMFEYYPDVLDAMPRDMIMACWHYDENVSLPRAHFFHRAAEDTLAKYDRMGFEYLICPSDYSLCNTETFTAYAARHRPLGGLLTTWEKSDCFLYQSMPLIACVGRLWAAGRAERCDAVMKDFAAETFGTTEPVFLAALRSICRSGLYLERRIRTDDFMTQGENPRNSSRPCLVDLLIETLPAYREKAEGLAQTILDEILLALRSEQLSFELDGLLPSFFTEEAHEEKVRRLEAICARLEAVARARIARWHQARQGIIPCRIESLYAEYLQNLHAFPALAASQGMLKVHFFLPDQYSAQRVRIFLKYDGSETYEKVADGIFKELRHFDGFFAKSFPIAKDRIPTALKVETSGFGGQGFTYFEIQNAGGSFIPAEVGNIEGTVTDPGNLLDFDWKWSFAGERNSVPPYFDPALAAATHGFEIALQRRD